MSTSYLNFAQSGRELDEIYNSSYYDYLVSAEFLEAFIKPLAERINALGKFCVDVGCGEGLVADYLNVPYLGIDCSGVAIDKALARQTELPCERCHTRSTFVKSRIEAVSSEVLDELAQFSEDSTLVLGNILQVTVKVSRRIEFIEEYITLCRAAHFIVYDLAILDETTLVDRFTLLDRYEASVDMPDLQPVKRARKILVFACTK